MLGKRRHVSGNRGSDQGKLIFILEERDRAGLEVPARNLRLAGLPEHRRRKNASRECDEPTGDAIQCGDAPLDDRTRAGSERAATGSTLDMTVSAPSAPEERYPARGPN